MTKQRFHRGGSRKWAWAIVGLALLTSGLRAEPAAPGKGPGESARKPGADEDAKVNRDKVDLSELPADEKAERKDLKKLGGTFQVFRTKHFSILHDVGDDDVKAFSIALERTFRSDVKYTMTLGIEPTKPKKKLIIYYFNEHQQYSDYSKSIGKGERPQSNPGVFFPDMNRSMFYNFRNQASYKKLREDAEKKLADLREKARGKLSADERRKLNREIAIAKAQSNFSTTEGGTQNEETLQHEVTHHVLWNIGFHNPNSFMANPRWFVEGTAMMFETAAKGKAANIGAVNKGRLDEYRLFEKQHKLHPVKDFVSDAVFFNMGGETVFISYAESWALVHYLNRTKRDRIKVYIAEINKRPKEYQADPKKELAAFEKAFGKLDQKWIDRWKTWMKKVH